MTVRFAVALVAAVLVAGCSTRVETSRLDLLRQDVARVRADQTVARLAPVPFGEAQQNLQLAEAAAQVGDTARMDHFIALAQTRLDTARARAAAQAAVEQQAAQAQRAQIESAESRAARLEAELEGLRARQTERGTVYTLSEVLFETGKAQLKPGAVSRLQPLADLLKSQPETRVGIEGHTDAAGSAEYNRELSQRRAEAVRDFLIGAGIEPQRVAARGMGEDFPIADNESPAGRQQNRRVEVLVSEAR
ncbi:MAG: OmpA family protein [Magnetospirillum sp.]|nr:OmpA family protein [Magnetospirillum sp.]